MKRRVLACLLILALLSAGCAAQNTPSRETGTAAVTNAPSEALTTETADTEENIVLTTEAPEPLTTEPVVTESTEPEPPVTEPPVTEPGTELAENPAFTAIAGPNRDPAILAVLYNATFVNGDPNPTEIWNEGEYDQLVICPRWIGSEVMAWQIIRVQDEEGEFEYLEGPIYSTVCEEGTRVGAALDRPEGGAAWALSVTAPDGSAANKELFYNGRYGTYACEYLIDNSTVLEEGSLSIEPEVAEVLIDYVGEDAFCALLREAARQGKDPWAVMYRYCTNLSGCFGDSMAYTICQGDMDGDAYYLQAALMHENYDPDEGSVDERAAYQAALYAEIGNDMGIHGPSSDSDEPLWFELDGLTVYNPTLLAQEVTITVNGIEIGTFDLTEGDFITFLDLCVGELSAEGAIQVEVRVTESRGDPAAAIIEVWPGVSGNISGAI